MDTRYLSLAIGAVVHGAFYFAAVIALSLMWGFRAPAMIAAAGLGVTYLSFLVQLQAPKWILLGGALVSFSVALGLTAGLALLKYVGL